MSALFASRVPVFVHAPLLPDSPYQTEEEDASSLLLQTCAEQHGRLHVLALLSACIVRSSAGRKRKLLADEANALRELIEAVWCELGCAFPDHIVQVARTAVEYEVDLKVRGGGRSHWEQQLLF